MLTMFDCDSSKEVEAIVKKLFNVGEFKDVEFLSAFLDEAAANSEVEKEKCCICLEDVEESRALLGCGHTFHLDCIYAWLEMKGICPSCRKAVR
ncbi:RING-type domain-containing protein [Encephalitozoon hellem]|uniref:RING-type E3 ubiquitin transferase n=1 Tax=Encephalitozoon hellem TaxID=27973 RepID=A0ABY8CLU1_ENCHE|nr:RING-type domain-containing protein [Encephalitozoon hellem]